MRVSDEHQLEEIRKEVEGSPEDFRKVFGFWPIAKVVQASEQLASVMGIIDELRLVQGEF
jgi:hypothetical protein